MKRTAMKRNILIAACSALFLTAITLFPHYGHAGGGGWRGIATEWTQLANNAELVGVYGKEVEQLAKQLEQIQLALQQYENMVAMAKQLTDFEWINATGYIVDLQRIVTRAGSLYTTIGQFDEMFRKQYPGYRADVAQYTTLSGYTAAESKEYLNELSKSVGEYDMTLKDFETTGKTLETLQKRSSTAEGRMQVLQVANDIAVQTGQEMGKLRIAVAAQSDMIAKAEARRTQREADAAAAECQTRQDVFAPYHPSKESRDAYLDFLGPSHAPTH